MSREEIITYLENHKSELETKFGVKKIGLFGSYAHGTAHNDSDIDIVVELDKPDLLTMAGIKQMIEEDLSQKVDVIRYRERMNQTLKKRIDRDTLYI